ncbi:hypothetical protein DM01DRAFT_1364821 [Hesseltinella vesiculosa]|uniref:Uncharacterized protein n=1 Tax=Hesseltinella vesiculosa TaxID=101127 RepID=A0A1X2G3Q4_9FUNG|nr:hypothetical protein DM01DRAFT_1364821 [Hesseltinella vesiculosa]
MSSMSWLAEKSSAELIPLLKNAYHNLKDKERDLLLAAEIGKSLLENNIAMKQRYEQLLTHSRAPLPDALPTPSSSLLTSHTADDDASLQEFNSDQDDEDDDDTMGFVSSQSTREAMIEVLESRNKELTAQLDSLMDEQSVMNKNKVRQHRALEDEIQHLTSTLDMATHKIQELEAMNGRSHPLDRSKKRTDAGRTRASPNSSSARSYDTDDDDDDDVDTLLTKIDRLQSENNLASKSKQELETKLASTLQDLCQLKSQFDQFQFTRDDHEQLKTAYERQFRHIDELNATVEEHRSLLQRLKDQGVVIHSANTTPAPSCAGDDIHTVMGDRCRQTLLAELENEWRKQQPALTASTSTPTHRPQSSSASSSSSRKKSTSVLPMSLSHLSLQDLPSWTQAASVADFETMLARAAGVDQQSLDEAIQFVNRLETSLMTPDPYSDDADDATSSSTATHPHSTTSQDDDHDHYSDLVNALDLPRDQLYPNMSLLPPRTPQGWVTRPSPCTDLTTTPRSFTGRIQSTARNLFRAVWRWCRFAIVLTTAVLISVWNGPDHMLLQN